MECQICQQRKKEKNLAPRCQCSLIACIDCIEQFGKAACASCGLAWARNSFFSKKFPAIFLKETSESFWTQEQDNLVKAQPWVDWAIECEAIKKQYRQGIRQKLPTKPQTDLSTSTTIFFSCPMVDCHGFLTALNVDKHNEARCPLCKHRACLMCHEAFLEGHSCNADILKNLNLIAQECVACPCCKAQVYKTAGCDHMFCTHCRHHFDWKTGRPLKNSTNGHQNSTVAWSKFESKPQIFSCEEQERSDLLHDTISKTQMATKVNGPSIEKLQRLTETLRYLYKSKFQTMQVKYTQDLMNLRVKFLRKEISKEQYILKGLKLQDSFHQQEINRDLLAVVLMSLNDLQQATFYDGSINLEDSFKGLVEICQASDSTFHVSSEFLLSF